MKCLGGHKLLYLIHTAGVVLMPSIYPAVARDGKHSQAIQINLPD